MPDGARTLQQPLIVNLGEVIPWRALSLHDAVAPDDLETYLDRLSTFEMPGGRSADPVHISLQQDGVSFGAPGSYFFSVPCGCAKVLVRKPGLGEQDRCIEIADFVSNCSAHSMADYHKVAVGADFDFSSSVEKLFVSNQPLGLNCGEVAVFLVYLMKQQGHDMRRIWFYQAASRSGHIVAYAILQNGGVILDSDLGVAIPWTPQQLLADRVHDFANVPLIPFRPKRDVAIEYRPNIFSRSEWAWHPTHAGDKFTFTPEDYRQKLSSFCEQIEVAEVCADNAGGVRIGQKSTVTAP